MTSGSLPHSLHVYGTSATNGGQSFAGLNLGTINYASGDSNSSLNATFNSLPNASDAPFNAYQRQHDPTCLPGTRVDLLREIHNWADGQDERCIFWLSGLAGTGKSTIARTIARSYYDRQRLAASFFFSRGGGDISHAGRFVTSIAVQIADNVPASQQYIHGAVAERSRIASESLRDQWRHLVLSPLSKLSDSDSSASLVLVVDALDECDSHNNIRTIVQLLAEARSLKGIRLRVLLTSRPEVPIRHGFDQVPGAEHQNVVLHNISRSIIDHDIALFLEHNLQVIAQEQHLRADWPGVEIVAQLVQSASGLFIWAATACRFIQQGKRRAAKRLETILCNNGATSVAPEKHLNEIYAKVLYNSIQDYTDEEEEEQRRTIQYVLGSIVVLFSPLSAQSLDRLLGIANGVRPILEDFHAILDIPNDQSRPLRLHHPSFRDFLLNKGRCGNAFWVVEKQAHQRLANNCLELMSSSLKQGTCGVSAPDALTAETEGTQLEQCLPPELQYACLYWIQHLWRSGAQLHDGDQVHCFLKVHLLHWLEALGWMKKVSEAIHAIVPLESLTASHRCPQLSMFVHDIKRFMLYNRPAIEQAPLQTYYSALVFTPEASLVRRQFSNCTSRWMRRLPTVDQDWSGLIQTIEGHSSWVNAVAFSPDGRLLVSASNDNTIKLWDARSGALLQTLEGHSDSTRLAVFSPDGKLLASVSHASIKLWDVGSGSPLQTFEGHSSWVNAVAFSRCSQLIASVSRDKTIKVWDAGSGATLLTVYNHSHASSAVTFSPGGDLLASTVDDGTLKLWEVVSGKVLQTFEERLGNVTAVAFSNDGKLLASVLEFQIDIWDAESGEILQILNGHSGTVEAMAFSPDGKLLVSAAVDQTAKLWCTSSGRLLHTLRDGKCFFKRLTFSPDGKVLALGADDGTVQLWDPQLCATLGTFEGNSASVHAVAFSPDGKLLVSASNGGTMKLWDTGSGAVQRTLKDDDWVETAAISPDNKLLVSIPGLEALYKSYGLFKLWDIQSGEVLKTLEGHMNYTSAVAFSQEGKLLASASDFDTVNVWDARSGALLYKLGGHLPWVNAIAYSGNGKLLATASENGTLRVGDAESGELLWMIKGHSESVSVVVFSPDGKLLASGSGDGTGDKVIKLWDVRTGALRQTFDDHLNYIDAVAISPDNKLLASASFYKTLQLWDAMSGKVRHKFEGHMRRICAVAFSPDGRWLASASDDRTVKLWNVTSETFLRSLEGHSDCVNAVVFSPDGKLLASASSDKTVKLWDARSGDTLRTFEGHSDSVHAVAFSPDSKMLASGSGDMSVNMWNTASGILPHTLYVGLFIQSPFLSATSKSVEINWRSLNISSPCSGDMTVQQPQLPSPICIKDQWVSRHTERILWLPPEHRPEAVAIHGSVVCFGYSSGRVTFMEFQL